MGSRGSVIPFFLQKRPEGVLPITDPEMTRFNITLQEAVEMVFWALDNALGGEIFVPKIPSYRIIDVAEAVGPECTKPVTGIRPGEKIHEEMITASDSTSAVDLGKYYAILASAGGMTIDRYLERRPGTKLATGFSYNSGSNERFLGVEELRGLIRQHIDATHVA